MSKNTTTPKSQLGPVARDKYETLLRDRIDKRAHTLRQQIEAQHANAMMTWLQDQGLGQVLATYNTAAEKLIAALGSPSYHYGSSIAVLDLEALSRYKLAADGMEHVLRAMPALEPVYAELKRLEELKDQVTEKVWLAQVPAEIAELLNLIG